MLKLHLEYHIYVFVRQTPALGPEIGQLKTILANLRKIGKGITAASGNFDDHLDLLEFLCINVMTSQKTTYNIPNVRMFGIVEV